MVVQKAVEKIPVPHGLVAAAVAGEPLQDLRNFVGHLVCLRRFASEQGGREGSSESGTRLLRRGCGRSEKGSSLGLGNHRPRLISVLSRRDQLEERFPRLDGSRVLLLRVIENVGLVPEGVGVGGIQGQRPVEVRESLVHVTTQEQKKPRVGDGLHIVGLQVQNLLVSAEGLGWPTFVESQVPEGQELLQVGRVGLNLLLEPGQAATRILRR